MADLRLEQLTRWCAGSLGHDAFTLAPASTDASLRRYFRVSGPTGTLIAMDAPPPEEDTGGFVRIAGLLKDAGVHAPEIVAHEPVQGFILLEDLGTRSFLDELNQDNADGLFEAALSALVRMQSKADSSGLPPFDQTLLRRELDLFPNWYLARHLGKPASDHQRNILESAFRLLEESCLAQPRVFVHRDFMPRNLMLSDPNPGVIDFQDAVCGPVGYDVLCLFKDAYLSWPERRVRDWFKSYWSKARRAGVPVHADWDDFQRALDWTGIQRHLKVIGIFARLHYRDGKDGYLEDVPRFFRYIREAASRYPEFLQLMQLMDSWEAKAHPGALG